MNWQKQLFESYNDAVAAGFDNYIEECGSKAAANGLENGKYEDFVHDAVKLWNEKPVKFMDNRTPAEVISSIVSLNETLELYRTACIICDDSIPSILADKLLSFGSAAHEQMIELACDSNMLCDETKYIISIISIRLLGEWRVRAAIPRLITLLTGCDSEQQQVMEEIEAALVNICELDPMVEAASSTEIWSLPYDYLASAIAKAGKNQKADVIYSFLKEYFQKSRNKILGAANLAEYGDSRAIPALRGYAQRHLNILDKETFFEIKGAVEKLGGNMDDIAKDYKPGNSGKRQ